MVSRVSAGGVLGDGGGGVEDELLLLQPVRAEGSAVIVIPDVASLRKCLRFIVVICWAEDNLTRS